MKLTKEIIEVLKYHGYTTVTFPTEDILKVYDTVEDFGYAGYINDRGAINFLKTIFDENGVNRSADVGEEKLEKQEEELEPEVVNPEIVESDVVDEPVVDPTSTETPTSEPEPEKVEEKVETETTKQEPEKTEEPGEYMIIPKKTTKKTSTKKKSTEKES